MRCGQKKKGVGEWQWTMTRRAGADRGPLKAKFWLCELVNPQIFSGEGLPRPAPVAFGRGEVQVRGTKSRLELSLANLSRRYQRVAHLLA